jgi:hypothetical protein
MPSKPAKPAEWFDVETGLSGCGASLGAELDRVYEAVDEAAMIPPAPIITFLREILISNSPPLTQTESPL